MSRKYSKATLKTVKNAMYERRRGTLKSGKGRAKVAGRRPALAFLWAHFAGVNGLANCTFDLRGAGGISSSGTLFLLHG
jgi:hypothetical protein